jgi:transposase
VLRGRGVRVVVANTRRLQAISQAKTDRMDARTLPWLLAAGLLAAVWTPDELTRALRRLTARRGSSSGKPPARGIAVTRDQGQALGARVQPQPD